MKVDAELYHVVGRYAFAFVFWMRQACVGQVEAAVQFLGSERRVGRIHHYPLVSCLLQEAGYYGIEVLKDYGGNDRIVTAVCSMAQKRG